MKLDRLCGLQQAGVERGAKRHRGTVPVLPLFCWRRICLRTSDGGIARGVESKVGAECPRCVNPNSAGLDLVLSRNRSCHADAASSLSGAE